MGRGILNIAIWSVLKLKYLCRRGKCFYSARRRLWSTRTLKGIQAFTVHPKENPRRWNNIKESIVSISFLWPWRKKVIKLKLLLCCTLTCWQLNLKNLHCGKAVIVQLCTSSCKCVVHLRIQLSISLSALNVRTDFTKLAQRLHLTGCRNQNCCTREDADTLEREPRDCVNHKPPEIKCHSRIKLEA